MWRKNIATARKDVVLMKCPVCHHQVSSDAMSCPNCGHPMQVNKKGVKEDKRPSEGSSFMLFVLVIIGIFVCLSYL